MALNFGALQTAQPVNAFFQGQQDVARNALAQEQAAQTRELNALRRQQAELGMEQTRTQMANVEEDRARARRVERAALFRDRLLRAPNPEVAREIVRMQYADPDLGKVLSQAGTLEQALAEVPDDPTQFETYRQQEAMGMGEWMKSQMPKVVGNAVYLPGQQKFVTAPVQRLVSVIGPDGKPTMVPADQAAGMTPLTAATAKAAGIGAPPARAAGGAGGAGGEGAPAGKPMTELQQQNLRKSMAADKTSVTNAQTVVGELEKLTDDLVGNAEKGIPPSKGLSGITGFQAMIPSMPKSEARKAQQKLDTLKGKVMAFGRQLAAAEGKLGNMAVQEWKFVSDSIQALDPAAGNLDEQLRDIVRQARNFASTVQERYDLTYEGAGEMQPVKSGKSNAPAGGGLTPAEQAELDQLRSRFGKKR